MIENAITTSHSYEGEKEITDKNAAQYYQSTCIGSLKKLCFPSYSEWNISSESCQSQLSLFAAYNLIKEIENNADIN